MAWSSPRTFIAGEIITASIMNTHVRDNLRYLHGDDGAPTIKSGLVIDNTDGDEYLKLPLLSTAEAGTVLDAEGRVAFDEQTHRAKYYDGTGVRSVVTDVDVDDTPVNGASTDPVSSNWAYDHVAAADPHTGYVLESLADAQGDMFYASADNTWARLAKGTAGQKLAMNAGATAPEWVTSAGTTFDTTEVFNGTAPTSYTDLDLSGTVGSNQAVCLLKVHNNSGDATAMYFSFRKNGDTDIFDRGVSGMLDTISDGRSTYLLIVTDSSGVVEWLANQAKTVVITMEAYLT